MRLCAVGDVLFGRYVLRGGAPFLAPVTLTEDPFAQVAAVLRRADLGFANLETPLMREPARPRLNGTLTFRAEPDRARLLSRAGLHVLSLANNHMTNLGASGAHETRNHLLAHDLFPVGAGEDEDEARRPQVVVVGGLRVAFLAYTLWHGDHPSVAPGGAVAHVTQAELLATASAAIAQVRRTWAADWVVLSLHWGQEYAPHPEPAQRELAHALVDAGADVILGHHPHVLQDFERYRGGVIAYSLGNFLFDDSTLSRRQSVILEVTLRGAGPARELRELRLWPVQSGVPDNVPRLAQGAEHRALRERLAELAPAFDLAPAPQPATQLRAAQP